MRVCVVHNPVAGSKRDSRPLVAADIPDVNVTIVTTERPGHAEQIARQAARDGHRIVVAAGGDGTVNEVARGLLGTNTALGIIPRGSGNGLARHLGIALDEEKALLRLCHPRFDRIDVGRINGRPYFCTAGIGFDAHVSRLFAHARNRGFNGYLKLALKEYAAYRPTIVEACMNGRTIRTSCYLMAFANASQYGNNAYIAPHANLADGVLDICVIDRLPPWRALRVAYALMAGTLPASGAAEFHTADAVTVWTEHPIEFHVDGEFVEAAQNFDVTLTPQELEIAI